MPKNSDKRTRFKKILVAVDHAKQTGNALETAVLFAKVTEAKIHGLYVREEHWGRLTPSATFINEFTGKAQSLEENRLDQKIEAIARRLERRVKAITHRHEITQTWQSVRGRVIEEILKAAKEADLITIGRRGGSTLAQKRLGSTAKAIIERSKKPVLVLAEKPLAEKPIIAIYDESSESHEGVALALSIAEQNKNPLLILALFNKDDDENRNKELERLVDNAPVPINVATLTQRTIGNFIHFIQRQNPGLIIIPKKQPLLKEEAAEMLLHYLRCSMLFMSK